MKKLTVTLFIILALAFSTLAACGGSPANGGSNQTSGSGSNTNPTISMSGVTFSTNSITISKGSTITFTTQQGGAHNLVNGTNGHPAPETGVPDFGSGGQTVAPGKSWTTPAWNTAGTFHVTCTYHPNTMTLTVTVN